MRENAVLQIIIGDVPPVSRLAKLEGESARGDSSNSDPPEVDRPVVKIAEGREVAQLMATAAALVLDVVEIEPDGPSAAGHGAMMAISREHLLAFARRDGGGRSRRRGRVERAKVDGIAGSALDDSRVGVDIPAASVLPCSMAIRALLEGDLVRG